RPKGFDSSFSLSSLVDDVADEIEKFMNKKIDVKFGVDCVGSSAQQAIDALQPAQVLILENLRFHKEEQDNDDEFAKALARNSQFYINDAFSCSHRSHASITGVAELLPSFAGLLLEKEVNCLTEALESPERPMAAIVGGSKISTKIDMLYSLINKADNI